MRALIPTGLGFNCENESKRAFELAGGSADIVDIRDLISGEIDLFRYDCLMIIGGFSYGDDLGSGKAVSDLLRFRKINGERFIDLIKRFVVKEKRVVFGVCNGFQVLVRLGILPGFDGDYEDQRCTLSLNNSGRYEDRWVRLKFNPSSNCIATEGLDQMDIPVRHGEGNLIFASEDDRKRALEKNHHFAQYVDDNGDPTMAYPKNPNGSRDAIAGICDETGRIFGMMPHPEAFLLFENHPHWTRMRRDCIDKGIAVPKEGDGLRIFKNIVEYCEARR